MASKTAVQVLDKMQMNICMAQIACCQLMNCAEVESLRQARRLYKQISKLKGAIENAKAACRKRRKKTYQ